LNSNDGRRGKKIRTRKKYEPFGEDPLGTRDMHKAVRLDADVADVYDANKKKRLQRKKKKHDIEETIDANDIDQIRKIIRDTIAELFFSLYKKRQVWK